MSSDELEASLENAIKIFPRRKLELKKMRLEAENEEKRKILIEKRKEIDKLEQKIKYMKAVHAVICKRLNNIE